MNLRPIALPLLLVAVLLISAFVHAQETSLSVLQPFLTPDLARSIEQDGERLVDVIVHLKEQVDVAQVESQVESKLMMQSGVSVSVKSDFVALELVHQLQLTADLTQGSILSYLQSEARENDMEVTPLWIVNAITINRAPVRLLVDLVARFGERAIDLIETDEKMSIVPPVKNDVKPVRAHRHGNDVVEVNLEYLQATDLWQLGYTGKGMTVAVVDTGVDAIAHPALKDKYRGKHGDHNYNWFDPYKKSQEPHDSDKHGTHCTGIVLGSQGDETQQHYYGVAPKADFIACMGLNRGSGSNSKLLKCWQFVLAPTNLKGKKADSSKRPHITSNSWGGPYNFLSKSFKKAAATLRAAGIFNAVAAGNSGRSGCKTIGSPGVFDNLFTVCAMDHRNGNVTSFSSRGPVPKKLGSYNKPDACAPGQAILSSVPGGQYASYSGTSMATPHIAGAIALLWEAVPELARDVEKTEQLLRMTSLEKIDTQCGAPQPIPNYVYGHGNVRLLEAFKRAKGMKM